MSDFTRIKFDWGYRDVYKNGFGMVEYVRKQDAYFVTPNDLGKNTFQSIRECRKFIRDYYRKPKEAV